MVINIKQNLIYKVAKIVSNLTYLLSRNIAICRIFGYNKKE